MNDLLADVRGGASTSAAYTANPFVAVPPAGSGTGSVTSSGGGAAAPAADNKRRTGGGTGAGGKQSVANGRERDVEMGELGGGGPAPHQDPEMKRFFDQVAVIRADIAEIKQLQASLRDEHERSKVLIKSKEVHKSRQDMQGIVNRVSALATKVKSELLTLEQGNAASLKQEGRGQNSVSERMRTSITSGLKLKLKAEMDGFSKLRARIQDEYRDVVSKRVYTVTGQRVSEDDVDQMIESGDAETLFQRAVVQDQAGRQRVLDTLAEVQERHDAVKELEQSMVELHQIFVEMALYVEEQGEMLNNIQLQVERADIAMVKGVKQLEEAKDYKNRSRKLWCWGTIIVLIIIILIVIFTVQPWKYVPSNR